MTHLGRRACALLLLASLADAAAPPVRAGENYAFLVAVGDYSGSDFRKLEWTRNDILEFSDLLLKSGFPRENVVVLHDDLPELTKRHGQKARHYLAEGAKIRSELSLLLSGIDADDTLIVAFSGHGVQLRDPAKPDDEKASRFFFCPLDGSLRNRATLVSLNDVYAELQACKAARKLLLVDACRDDPLSKDATKRVTVDLDSATRPETEPPPKGTVALFSCIQGQTSNEVETLKHGLFFHHVLEGWKGNPVRNRRPDLDADGQLTFEELAQFVKKGTSEYARVEMRKIQTPEFEGKLSGEWVLRKYDANVEKVITNSLGAKLVRIPAGEYLRGSSAADIARMLRDDSTLKAELFADEQPQHRVRITQPFYLGHTEVTQAEWNAVMETAPSFFSPSGDGKDRVGGLDTSRFPVETVTWFDAVEYCIKLSAKERLTPFYLLSNVERKDGSIVKADVARPGGKGYRLPTEAEWEYACRAGTTSRFHFGDASNGEESNVDGKNPLGTSTIGPSLQRTTTVGSYAENAFGLVDMHGNVWEWCQDRYEADAYKPFASEIAVDPQGPSTKLPYRVLRGGSWDDLARVPRSAAREKFTPVSRVEGIIGFRVARSP